MSFQTGKNVWGKTNRHNEKNNFQTNFKSELQNGFGHPQVGQAGNNLTFGPFGTVESITNTSILVKPTKSKNLF